MEPYLKDQFAVQGIFTSSNCFLILTEGTLYIYDKEKDYEKGKIPKEILHLQAYKVTIEQSEGKVLCLQNIKNIDEKSVFYSNRREQIECWFNAINRSTQNYKTFLQGICDGSQKLMPFEEMELQYSIEVINESHLIPH